MLTPSKFIPIIMKDILEYGLTSAKNEEFGGTKNTLKQCIKRDNKIGKKPTLMLCNAIKKKPEKHSEVKKYLNNFLTKEEQNQLKNLDVCKMLECVISKINTRDKRQDFIVPTTKDTFKIVHLNQLLEMGYSIKDVVKIGIGLDYETIEDLTEEHNGSLEQWINVARYNADTIRWLMDDNKIIGYWHFTALFDKHFKKAKEGNLFDSEITIDKIPVFLPGIYNIYFIGICLKENYRRKTTTFGKLLFSILEVIESLAQRGAFINEICTQAYTENGIQLSKSIGLKYIKNHAEHGEIYWGKIENLLDKKFVDNFTNLKKLYKKHYNL